ncbi:MAG: hypothetical protein JO125_16515 [Chloroflexi bacterium]|nr:hypothetical protein [Chloroflexota bacterium]
MLLLGAFVVAAIREQLNLPPPERTWHGTLFGVPYDFRLPTPQKLRDTLWNKDTSQIMMPTAFGVGWSFNLYPLLRSKLLRTLIPGA